MLKQTPLQSVQCHVMPVYIYIAIAHPSYLQRYDIKSLCLPEVKDTTTPPRQTQIHIAEVREKFFKIAIFLFVSLQLSV